MKPINLSEEDKINLFQKFFEKFKSELDNFSFNSASESITIKTGLNEVAKEKVHIIFTPEAYLRMQALVDYFSTEVGWYGLVERVSPTIFRVYDVKVCKQYVNGAKVDTEDEDTLEFFGNLTDEEADHMHFQAHSHVRMSTSASGVDLQNQQDVIKNMGKTGFYIFQIWNKNGDINTYLYDLDNNVFYDKKDVEINIEDSLGILDDFIGSVEDLVQERNPYQKTSKKEETPQGKDLDEKDDNPYYGNDYWAGYYGRSDW